MAGRLCGWEGVRVRGGSDRDEADGEEVIYERILLLFSVLYIFIYLLEISSALVCTEFGARHISLCTPH